MAIFSSNEEWEGTGGGPRRQPRAPKRRKRGHVSITQLGPTGKDEEKNREMLVAVRSTSVLVEFTRWPQCNRTRRAQPTVNGGARDPPSSFSLSSFHRFSGLRRTGHPNNIFTSSHLSICPPPFHSFLFSPCPDNGRYLFIKMVNKYLSIARYGQCREGNYRQLIFTIQ